MVVRMARGFASLEFPSTYTMSRDSLTRYPKRRVHQDTCGKSDPFTVGIYNQNTGKCKCDNSMA